MPNKNFFLTAVILLIIGAVMMIISGYFEEDMYAVFVTGVIILLIGVYLLVRWDTRSYVWKCSNCEVNFRPTMYRNLVSLNVGVHKKKMKCPSCKKTSLCYGIPNNAK